MLNICLGCGQQQLDLFWRPDKIVRCGESRSLPGHQSHFPSHESTFKSDLFAWRRPYRRVKVRSHSIGEEGAVDYAELSPIFSSAVENSRVHVQELRFSTSIEAAESFPPSVTMRGPGGSNNVVTSSRCILQSLPKLYMRLVAGPVCTSDDVSNDMIMSAALSGRART